MSGGLSFKDAVALHREGRLDAAELIYGETLRSDPKHAGALHLLGVIRQQQGLHQEAIDLIGRAISIDPDKAVYHNNHGAALVSLHRFAEAAISFERALAIRPGYADARANLGMAQAALGDDAAAEASFRCGLTCHAWHRNSLERLVALLERQGRQAEAINLLESAFAAAPCPQFDLALRKLRLTTTSSLVAMHASLPTTADGVKTSSRRLIKDGTNHYTNDAQGNRTAKFQSTTGLLDSTASNITIYSWDDNNLVSVKAYANYEAFKSNTVIAVADYSSQDLCCDVAPVEQDVYDGQNPIGHCPSPFPASERRKRIAFVSPHCLIDFTNGAATATMDGLELLASQGLDCMAYCGTQLDSWEEVLVEEILARERIPYRARDMRIGPGRARMIFAQRQSVRVTMFNSASTRGGWVDRAEINSFLAGCEIFLRKNRPDAIWTYGGDPLAHVVQQLAKRQGIPTVFALHNFAYTDKAAFSMIDYVVVPTEAARRHYAEKLGLETIVLPPALNVDRVGLASLGEINAAHDENALASDADNLPAAYVTFVNPTPLKGLFFFARIAKTLLARRPDISLLVVEASATRSSANAMGIDFATLQNVRVMPNTSDAKQFLAMTNLLLMPSLSENAAMGAREAMCNGIPVLASTRGGLPETIGNAGMLFDIPVRYTPKTRDMPTIEEVAPWVDAIIRLWDDPKEYNQWSQAACAHAQQWHPDRLGPFYRDFLDGILHEPRPSILPRVTQ